MKRTKPKEDVIVEVDFKRVGMLVILVVMCALALFTVARFVFGFLEIKEFELEGTSLFYTREELVAASGLAEGDKLYSTDSGDVEKLLLEKCLYLSDVEVKRVFPNKIRFSVTEKSPQWYIELSDDFYVLDYDLTVLEETGDEERLRSFGFTKLVLPSPKRVMVGSVPQFGESELEIKRTCELIDILSHHSLKPKLTYANIAVRFDIKLTIDGIYHVDIGDMSSFAGKLDSVAAQLTEEFYAEHPLGGTFDATSAPPVTFRPNW